MNRWRTDNEHLLVDETLFSTANGYIGLRANFEEGYKKDYESIRGTYINGFYELVDITYGESAYGFPKTAQKILNVIDAQSIRISIDDEIFSLFSGKILDIERELNIVEGYSLRRVNWQSPKGHHLIIEIKRMTSFEQLELMIIDYKISSINYNGMIDIVSSIDGDVFNYTNEDDPRVAKGHTKLLYVDSIKTRGNQGTIVAKTKRSNLKMATTFGHDIDMVYTKVGSRIDAKTEINISAGERFSFTKYAIYTDSIRHSSPVRDGQKLLPHAIVKGKLYWFATQKAYLAEFWKYAHIDIIGDKYVEESLNYNIYQLLASAGKDPHSNISAKGLSGEGYEGHYFWDTEIYMLPLFILSNQEIAKNLLQFRYEILDASRDRAREMGHKIGAKIPWRTISGRECSGYFPAGSAQYHINADVAYAYIQYYLYTDDIDMILEFGYEVIYETARIWIDMGHFNDEGAFMINSVTGPDEYTAIVNNNYYTNVLAAYHLDWTYRLSELIAKDYPEEWVVIKDRLNITDDELKSMNKASEQMYQPFDKALGINLQDDGFKNRAEWDFEGTPKNHHPLLLHYHPLTIYRYKVLKQADTVLAYLLLDNESDEVMETSYTYYERLTTHDSSLSPCVYGMVASRINQTEKAYNYFMQTIRLDLDNLHSNTKDGLHIANAGGAYMSILYGFGGLRIKADGLHLKPTKPSEWETIRFRLNYKNSLVIVTIGEQLTIETEKPIEFIVDGNLIKVDGTINMVYHGKH